MEFIVSVEHLGNIRSRSVRTFILNDFVLLTTEEQVMLFRPPTACFYREKGLKRTKNDAGKI